jgi:hypothetical protein
MRRTHHILSAASNLLGITLLIIAGLHISNRAGKTFADEVAWMGAVCFSASCLLSYLSIRDNRDNDRMEDIADKIFLLGMLTLFVSVAVLAIPNI